MRSLRYLPLVLVLAPAAVAAGTVTVRDGETAMLEPADFAEKPAVNLTGGTLLLLSDKDAEFASGEVSVSHPNGEVTIGAVPATAAENKVLTLTGQVSLGRYTKVNTVGGNGYFLMLPLVKSDQPGPELSPAGAKMAVGTLAGNVVLAGSATGNTLRVFEGTYLQKRGPGSWTVTGDNSARTWNTSIESGELALAPGASLGSGTVSCAGTFSPAAGTSLAGSLRLRKDATVNLADGKLGPFTVDSSLAGPSGGHETLRLDLSDAGVDELVLNDPGETNDIRGEVQFNIVTPKLKPGTYTFVRLTKPGGTLMEHHFAFGFTGDPADHSHMVMTKEWNGYRLTIAPVVEKDGRWTAETLTVSAVN